jgi:hypothetical protein
MGKIYDECKDLDGFLYCKYSSEVFSGADEKHKNL